MKILLDENLPHDMRHWLVGHDCLTAAYLGWTQIRNGELLRRAADASFDVLITCDRGFQHQHNPSQLPIAVVVLELEDNRYDTVRSSVSALASALESLESKAITIVRP